MFKSSPASCSRFPFAFQPKLSRTVLKILIFMVISYISKNVTVNVLLGLPWKIANSDCCLLLGVYKKDCGRSLLSRTAIGNWTGNNCSLPVPLTPGVPLLEFFVKKLAGLLFFFLTFFCSYKFCRLSRKFIGNFIRDKRWFSGLWAACVRMCKWWKLLDRDGLLGD